MKEQLFISKQKNALRHFHQMSNEFIEIKKKSLNQFEEELKNVTEEMDSILLNIKFKKEHFDKMVAFPQRLS